MSSTYRMDGAGAVPGDRLERELRSWLRSFDPGALPIASRATIDRALTSAEAGRRRSASRFGRVPQVLRLAASLALLGLVLLTWFGLATSTSIVGAAPGVPTNTGPFPTPTADEIGGMNPVNQAYLVALFVVATGIALVSLTPVVRRLASVSMFGRRRPEPALEPRPLREWRRSSLIAWLAVLPPTGYVAWFVWTIAIPRARPDAVGWLVLAASLLVLVVPALAIPLRYGRLDGATRLLAISGCVPPVSQILSDLIPWGALDRPVFSLAGLTLGLVGGLGPLFLAAAVGRYAGSVRRPPWWLIGSVVAGVVFLLWAQAAGWVLSDDPAEWLELVTLGMPGTAIVLAFLAIAWVALKASEEREDPWPWRLVAIGAVASAVLKLMMGIVNLIWMLWPDTIDRYDSAVIAGFQLGPFWDLVTVLTLGIGLGLLAGLRQAACQTDGRPALGLEPEVDRPS